MRINYGTELRLEPEASTVVNRQDENLHKVQQLSSLKIPTDPTPKNVSITSHL